MSRLDLSRLCSFLPAALVLAVRPPPGDPTAPLLVAARALGPGAALTAGDVRVVRAPPDLRPRSALTDPTEVVGRVLVSGAGEGEPITGARLVGAENTALTAGPGSAAVPVRLADPAVAGLLGPGARVDVITTAPEDGAPRVLARDATVLTVRPEENARRGSLVLIALPADSATQVASAALAQPVAVTLR